MLGEWVQKVWGETRCTHSTIIYSRHELKLKAGTFCSFHWHDHRANIFRVVSGRVRIVWAHGWRLTRMDLARGEYFQVPSMVPHQFQVMVGGEMIEEYYPDRSGMVKDEDIHRLSEGGVIEGFGKHTFADAPVIHLPNGEFWQERRWG